MGAALILCESQRERRNALRERILRDFPEAEILKNNRDLLKRDFRGFDWALVVNDRCGYHDYTEGADLCVLQHIASCVKTDVVLTFNEGSWSRLMGMREKGFDDPPRVAQVRQAKALYAWMNDLRQWSDRLPGLFVARGPLVPQSSNYRFRFLVGADGLGDYIKRHKG